MNDARPMGEIKSILIGVLSEILMGLATSISREVPQLAIRSSMAMIAAAIHLQNLRGGLEGIVLPIGVVLDIDGKPKPINPKGQN